MFKELDVRPTFGRSDVVLPGKAQGFCTSSKMIRVFVAVSTALAGVGHVKRICKDAFCTPGDVQKTCSSGMFGGQGDDFLKGVAL